MITALNYGKPTFKSLKQRSLNLFLGPCWIQSCPIILNWFETRCLRSIARCCLALCMQPFQMQVNSQLMIGAPRWLPEISVVLTNNEPGQTRRQTRCSAPGATPCRSRPSWPVWRIRRAFNRAKPMHSHWGELHHPRSLDVLVPQDPKTNHPR